MQSPQVMSLVSRIVHELDDSSVDSTEGIIKAPAKRNSELLNSLLGTVTRSLNAMSKRETKSKLITILNLNSFY